MELIDSNQVCELLGVNHNHLHQLQHRKKLAWVEKKGRKVFYSREDVETLKVRRIK